MLKILLVLSVFSLGVTEIAAMSVEHGLFGKLDVIDHKDDIKAYNNWCLSQNMGIDDTDFLAKSCAEKCFKFDESNSEISYCKTEAENLLKSISKNPVAASAMKVLISKYNKYDENVLAKCGLTKDLKEDNMYFDDGHQKSIGEHHINVRPLDAKLSFFNIEHKDRQEYPYSSKRILVHEMMHFMDKVLKIDDINSGRGVCVCTGGINFLDAETLKRHTPCNSSRIDTAENQLQNQLDKKKVAFSTKRAFRAVYDEPVEMYGMYGLKVISYHQRSYVEFDDDGAGIVTESTHDYKLAYEPINDAMSCLYGFGEDDDIVGKIRTSHKSGLNVYPNVISTLEDNFHIYSFYKQPDVNKAFDFATKVVEEV